MVIAIFTSYSAAFSQSASATAGAQTHAENRPTKSAPKPAKGAKVKAEAEAGAEAGAEVVMLPPIISGQKAHQLLTEPTARAKDIQWLYSGTSTLAAPFAKVAQRIDWQNFVHTDSDGVRWRLNELSLVKDLLKTRFKLDPTRPVIIVGDSITTFFILSSGWGEEGRIAWMLEVSGFSQVSVVDGGYKAILASASTHASTKASTHASTHALGQNEQQGQQSWTTYDQLRTKLKSAPESLIVLDTRSWDEYRGLRSYVGRKGRIEGARHFHVDSFFDSSGKLRSKAKLLEELRAKGIDGSKPIVTYCSGGVRSAMAYYLLRHHLGFAEVSNYEGSWAEWSKRDLTTQNK